MIGAAGVRETLQMRREELLTRADRARDDAAHRRQAVSQDFSEQASERQNDDVLRGIESAARAEIEQIDLALGRLQRGEYGICLKCGQDIGLARLEAIPYADRCQSCVGH
ncbi:MAG: TraR/DksA family transcriptional regulator [Steroidobacteraceae bacterium]|jgi:RNA polymerase-binding protein DksA